MTKDCNYLVIIHQRLMIDWCWLFLSSNEWLLWCKWRHWLWPSTVISQPASQPGSWHTKQTWPNNQLNHLVYDHPWLFITKNEWKNEWTCQTIKAEEFTKQLPLTLQVIFALIAAITHLLAVDRSESWHWSSSADESNEWKFQTQLLPSLLILGR